MRTRRVIRWLVRGRLPRTLAARWALARPGQGLGEYAVITVLLTAIVVAGLLLLAGVLQDDLAAWATRWPVRRPT